MSGTSNAPATLVAIQAALSHRGTPGTFYRQGCRCASGVVEKFPWFCENWGEVPLVLTLTILLCQLCCNAKFPPSVLFENGGNSLILGRDATTGAYILARGEFVCDVAAHRNWLGDVDFPVVRYVLFVVNNCPWCHGVLRAQALCLGKKKPKHVPCFSTASSPLTTE